MKKINWNIILAILACLAFSFLLLIRMNFFQEKHEKTHTSHFSKPLLTQDSWMNIFQNDKKIGYLHRSLSKNNDQYLFNEKVLMEINSMGVTQALKIMTEGHLNSDMTLVSFNFNLSSSIFNFDAKGHVVDKKLILLTGLPDAPEKIEIPLKDIPLISGSLYDAAFYHDMESNSSRNFNIFDPSTMSIRPIKITRSPDEIIPMMGKRVLSKKYCADFMGAKHCAWLDKNGLVIKETGMLGLSMEKTNREDALRGIVHGASLDVTEIASIASNIKIDQPEKLNKITIKLTGAGTELFLNGDRQRYQNHILTVEREKKQTPRLEKKLPDEISVFLKPSPLIQSEDPQIKDALKRIVHPADSTEQKTRKIVDWVYRNIEKKPTLSVPNALEVLKNKSGDCNEHTVLTVALLRAAGIPATSEAGLVYLRGRFYYHAWCVFYLDQWITADAVFNQLPADVTHIRFIRGETDKQLNLISVIGKINLEVLTINND